MKILDLHRKVRLLLIVFATLLAPRVLEAAAPTSDKPLVVEEERKRLEALIAATDEVAKAPVREYQAVEEAIKKADLASISIPENFLDPSKLSEKKKQLQQLLTFLDESEIRLDKILTDAKWQVLAKIDADKEYRRTFVRDYDRKIKETKEIARKHYRTRRDIIWAHMKLLDFVADKVADATHRKADVEKIFESQEALEGFQERCDSIVNLFEAEEEASDSLEKRNSEGLSWSVMLAHPIEHAAFVRIEEIYEEKINPLNQAFDGSVWADFYTGEVASSPANIGAKKKEFEGFLASLVEMEKQWEKEIPDIFHRRVTPLYQSSQNGKVIEEMLQNIFSVEKKILDARKKYVLEGLEVLDVLSLLFGSYRVDKKEIYHAYGIEYKLIDSHFKTILEAIKEEREHIQQLRFVLNKYHLQLFQVEYPFPSS